MTLRIQEILECKKAKNQPVFSFEFFPPKEENGWLRLKQTITSLQSLRPDFCSVTYGAGGSTRQHTLELVSKIYADTHIVPMMHLTCLGSTVEQLREILKQAKFNGIENVLALRGDAPKQQTNVESPFSAQTSFRYASELVALVHDEFKLCTGAACYPEGHPETREPRLNIEHTRQKVLAGAEFLITQLFFDPALYFDFVARLRSAGIYTPVLPGIMPMTNLAQISRFTDMCGASIPQILKDQLLAVDDDPQATLQLGIAYATHQCVRLLEGGAPGIHFYTLNRSVSTRAILAALRASNWA